MEKETKKHKSSQNYYKISTYVLLAIIILAGIIFSINSYIDKNNEDIYTQGVLYGQQNAINIVLESVARDGFITISTPQGNLSLVPAPLIQRAQEDIILKIMNDVNENGYVSLYDNSTELILVEYIPQTQE